MTAMSGTVTGQMRFSRPDALDPSIVNEVLAFAREWHADGWPILTFTLDSVWCGERKPAGRPDIGPLIAWVEQVGWRLDRMDWISQATDADIESSGFRELQGRLDVIFLFRRAM